MSQTSPKAGVVVDGKYRLIEPLGEGGIGTVWRAWQELVDRDVAIKLLKERLDDEFRDRFLVEARALGRLNHQNCITIHDFGYSDELEAYYLVMEHLKGEPLDSWLGRRIPLPDVVEVGRQIANALAYAHHQGVLHRDLKPENVFLVDSFNGEMLVKVLDFGLARLVESQDERLTQSGEIFGTPVYMSPEQVKGSLNTGPATDLYSLGVMLFELIDNRLPFWGESPMDILAAHLNDPIPRLRRAVPSELAEIVYRLLEKRPDDRFENALALWRALDAVDAEADDESHTFVVVDSPDATWSHLPEDFTGSTAPGIGRLPSDVETLQDETLQDETLQDEPPTLKKGVVRQPAFDSATAVTLEEDLGTAETLADEAGELETLEESRAAKRQPVRPAPRRGAETDVAPSPPEPTEPPRQSRVVAVAVLAVVAALIFLLSSDGDDADVDESASIRSVSVPPPEPTRAEAEESEAGEREPVVADVKRDDKQASPDDDRAKSKSRKKAKAKPRKSRKRGERRSSKKEAEQEPEKGFGHIEAGLE